MGTQGFKFGNLDPGELIRREIDVFFGSTSPNSLFPDQLNETNQQPTLFYRDRFRDFYFHIGLEIPIMLLRSAKPVCEFYEWAQDLPSITVTMPEDRIQNSGIVHPQIRAKDHLTKEGIEKIQMETGIAASRPVEQTKRRHEPWYSTAKQQPKESTSIWQWDSSRSAQYRRAKR